MARKHRRRGSKHRRLRFILSVAAIVLIFLAFAVAARLTESRIAVQVENAGQQVTSVANENTAQVYMNGQWYAQKDVETLLVMGIDDYGAMAGSESYNNSNQVDFLMLYLRDKNSGESAAIHLNRDTMTDINVLGVTGESAGTRYAQLALAYTYGRGEQDSCRNTVQAVSRLLYGMEIDKYIAVTMNAVPIMNDWAGGVELEVMSDLTSIDPEWFAGETVTLMGEDALAYVRTRKGLDDSSNINRMERQRQYAAAWLKTAQPYLENTEAVADLVIQLEDYHYSDCTVDELTHYAEGMRGTTSIPAAELPGEAVVGEAFMEYYVDEEALQQLVLDMFYTPVAG